MNSKSLTSFYSWGVKIIIFVIPFLSLYISSSLYFPYITGRNFGFRILIELALVLWLGLILLRPEYRPKSSFLLWALLIFVFVIGLANVFGIDSYYSFWSRFERMEGFIMILHLLAYFIITTTVFKSRKDWLILFNIFVAVGLIVSFYGLLQVAGVLRSIQGGAARVDGTIGNPAYLGAYLLSLLMPTLYLLTQAIKKFAKYYYGISASIFVLMIYFSGTRGAMLALVIGLILYAILYLLFFAPKDNRQIFYRKIVFTGLIFAILLPTTVWLLRDSSLVRGNKALSRFANISLTEKTTRSRFMIWNIGLQAFLDRPILGYGQENFTYAFLKYYNPNLYDQEPWFDRAHNILVDWLINAGILGLLTYLMIFIAAFHILWRLYRSNSIELSVALIIFVGLIAYIIQNLFVFDNFNTYIIFFSIIAFVNNIANSESVAGSNNKEDFKTVSKRINLSVSVLAVAIVVMVPVIYFANIKPIQASQSMIEVFRLTSGPSTPDAVSGAIDSALQYETFGNNEIMVQFTRLAIQLADGSSSIESKINFVNFAINRGEDFLNNHPNDYKLKLFLGGLYNKAASLTSDGSLLARGREYLQEVVAFSPNYQPIYLSLADNYVLSGDISTAIDLLQTAVALAPQNPVTQTSLGVVAILGNKIDIADDALNRVLNNHSLGSGYIPNLIKLAGVYYNARQLSQAIEIYEKIVQISPEADYYANLTSLYLELGLKDKAIFAAQEASRLDPVKYQAATDDLLEQIK
ncbi:MAG: O-antigen ligase family protein [bacterium]|nr:O-antigen ligase family protein [bacterium]